MEVSAKNWNPKILLSVRGYAESLFLEILT